MKCLDSGLACRCPVCRAPPPSDNYVAQLYTLPVDQGIDNKILAQFPDHHAASLRRRALRPPLPTIPLTLLEDFEQHLPPLATLNLKTGSEVVLTISEPRYFLMLIEALANKGGSRRFGMLSEDRTKGFIAGVMSPQVGYCKSPREAIAKIFFRAPTSRMEKPHIRIKVLLVDTFLLAGPPEEFTVDSGTRSMLTMTQWKLPEVDGASPLRTARCVAGKASGGTGDSLARRVAAYGSQPNA